MHLNSTTVTANHAISDSAIAGGGILNLGTLVLTNSTIAHNIVPHPNFGANLLNGGNATYLLPAPLGYYLDGVFQCAEALCPNPLDPSQPPVKCPAQSCDDSSHGLYLAKLPEGPIDQPVPTLCPAGFHAASIDQSNQSSALCSGLCPAGHTCLYPGTIEPNRTAAGFFAPDGSTIPQPCGSASVYCPEGSPIPVRVADGQESFTNLSLNPHLDPNDPATRTSQRPVPAGYIAVGGKRLACGGA